MNFLFVHRNFPAQFRHIITELGKNPDNNVIFITGTKNEYNIKGVKKITYSLKRKVPDDCHSYLKDVEESIIHGQSAAEVCIALRESGFIPNVIYAHSWGNSLYLKDIFPNVPVINFCEWYFNSANSDVDFVNKSVNENKKAEVRTKNMYLLPDLVSCDLGICPTNWQKSQIPKEFHHKIKVIHDGIDTDYFTPDKDVIFEVPNTDLKFTRKDKVVTYATRGMEPYRGFPEFMKMTEKLLKERDDVHVVIAGEDRVCYGQRLQNGTFKELMLKTLDLDMERVHFTGGLPYNEYKKLLQVSSVHVYLTYPFVLSWSTLEAMSTGCCIVASKTPPVEEFIKDNENGILTDFFDINELLNKVNFALDNPGKIKNLRENARKTIVENYDLKAMLPKLINTICEAANK